MRPADRRFRQSADVHDDLQLAVLRAFDRGSGLQKSQDMYAFWGHVEMLSSLDKKLAFVVEEATRRFDIKLRTLDRSRFHEDVRMFLDIYNRSMVGTWGFVPMSEAEIDHMAASLKHLIVPEMTTAAEVNGEPVGAVFGLLDYNPRIRKINGRLFPFGFLRLLMNKKAIKRIRLISHECGAGVPEVGHRAGPVVPIGARRTGLGNPRGRVLVGLGEQPFVLSIAETRRRQDHENLSFVRWRIEFRSEEVSGSPRTADCRVVLVLSASGKQLCTGRRDRVGAGSLAGVKPTFGRAGRRGRLLLAGLRLLVIALIVLAMLRPTHISTTRKPQTSVLLVLLDSSRSMQLPDT
jgi:hypothetical protein